MHNRKSKKQSTDNTKNSVFLNKPEKVWTESKLETLVCDALNLIGWTPLKFHSNYSTGWPDRILLTDGGVMVWCEFKKPGGKFARLQEINRAWLIRNDHAYYQLDSYELCRWFLDKVVPILSKNKQHEVSFSGR